MILVDPWASGGALPAYGCGGLCGLSFVLWVATTSVNALVQVFNASCWTLACRELRGPGGLADGVEAETGSATEDEAECVEADD